MTYPHAEEIETEALPAPSNNSKSAPAKAGRPRKQKMNTQDYITLFEKWGVDARLNLCSDDIEIDGERQEDIGEMILKARVRDHGTRENVSVNIAHALESVATMANRNSFHPIRDYLNGLEWDGEDHLENLASHFDADDMFKRWLETWLSGAVARVFTGWQNPMLVLIGKQGIGKSYLSQWLCSSLPDMFIESAICPDQKDYRIRLMRNFIWEVQELGSTTRKADQDALKGFITLGNVSERKSYGRHPTQKPAICSFIGTVNPDSGFLTDLTGNRRYIVTNVKSIDWQYSSFVDVDQIWAQAMHKWRESFDWQLTSSEKFGSEQINREHMVVNPVHVYLELKFKYTGDYSDFVPTTDMCDWLHREAGIPNNTGTARVIASLVKSWGGIGGRATIDGKKLSGYKGIAPIEKTGTQWT